MGILYPLHESVNAPKRIIITFAESPTTAPTIQAPVGGPTSSSETCSGDGSFTITASAAPHLDGCFEDAGVTTGDGSVFYTVASVTAGNAEVVVFSGENDNGDVSPGDKKRVLR